MAGFWWIFSGLWISFWVVFFVNDFNGLTRESMKMRVFIGFGAEDAFCSQLCPPPTALLSATSADLGAQHSDSLKGFLTQHRAVLRCF
jgi:hypothetical protein